MINVKDLYFSYNSFSVIENVSFVLDEGVFAGLIGPNGGGKTTLLKLLLGLLKPDKGSIKIVEKDAYKLGRDRYKIGYVPQIRSINQEFPISVFDLVLMGVFGKSGILSSPSKADKTYVLELLEMFDLIEKAQAGLNTLSGGQLQKAHIARALVAKPEIMLFDEATVGLDAVSLEKFYDFIIDIKKAFSLTVIMVSHDVDILNAKTDVTLCINKKLHCHGPSKHLSKEKIRDVFSCELEDFTEFKNKLKA